MPSPVLLWSLREDVRLESGDDGTLVMHNRWGEMVLPRPEAAVRTALHRMVLGPISLDNVTADPAERGGLRRALDGLQHLVVRSIGWGVGRPLLSLVPLTAQARYDPAPPAPGYPVRLSRFALLRSDGAGYRLESPLSLYRAVVHRVEAMWLISVLGAPVLPEAARARLPRPGLPCAELIDALVAVGLVVRGRPGAAPGAPPLFAEDHDAVLAAWTPDDLMFHTRSTLGRHDNAFGATFPFGGRRRPRSPARRPPGGIELLRPRRGDVVAGDPPLTLALEAPAPSGLVAPTAAQLGELLYRTVRLRSMAAPGGEPGAGADVSAGQEFELYVTVDACDGIPAGVYHYDPSGHLLEPLDVGDAGRRELLESASPAARLKAPPPVLLTFTARFQRLSWWYEGPSYMLVLRDVGSMLHLLLLVCTTMGLPGRAQDFSDIDVGARVLGTDWRIESAVGGFVVGVSPEPDPGSHAGPLGH